RLAVEHLIKGGATRVALVNGPHDVPQCAAREEGAREAMRAAGLPEEALVIIEVPEMTISEGVRAATTIRAAGIRNVFGTNDQLAIGTLRGLVADGSSAREFAVVGYGDLAFASESLVPLTTVRQPKELMGRAAVEL